MKFSKYFMLAGAAALFAACSSEEPVPAPDQTNGEPVGYVKIAIGTNDSNTRAGGDTPTTNPKTVINSVQFFFFEGNDLKETFYAKSGTEDWLTTTHEATIDQCVVVPITSMKIDKVAVVVNHAELGEDANLDNLALTNGKNGNYFVMSSASVYNTTGTAAVYKTDLEKGSIYLSKTDASKPEATATVIYVERVLAKVEINKDDNLQINIEQVTEQGSNTALTVEFTPEKVYITSTNDNSWMFKRLPSTLPEGLSSTDVNGTNRTFWTLGHLVTETTAKISNPSYTNASGTWGDVHYAFDHVGTTYARRTSVIVAGKYTIKKDGVDIATTNGGTFYLVPDEGQYNVYTSEEEVMKAMNNGVAPAAGAKLSYNKETAWWSLQDKDGNDISGMRCMKYDAGRGYYSENIRRFEKDDKKYYGIVRNHHYKVKVNEITGMGIGVKDDYEPIIPINPKDPANMTYYVHMSVNVLDWQPVAEQGVAW